MKDIILQISQIHAGYGSGDVLQNVSLDIHSGEIVATIGRNGVGKSTLMKTVMGLLPVRSGTVTYKGEDITKRPARWRARHGIGFVPQGREIFPLVEKHDNGETLRDSPTIRWGYFLSILHER